MTETEHIHHEPNAEALIQSCRAYGLENAQLRQRVIDLETILGSRPQPVEWSPVPEHATLVPTCRNDQVLSKLATVRDAILECKAHRDEINYFHKRIDSALEWLNDAMQTLEKTEC